MSDNTPMPVRVLSWLFLIGGILIVLSSLLVINRKEQKQDDTLLIFGSLSLISGIAITALGACWKR